MSQFISTPIPMQSLPIVQLTKKQIIIPKIKKLIRYNSQPNQSSKIYSNSNKNGISYNSEQKVLNSLCLKLTQKQYQKVARQNQILIENYIRKLKKRKNKYDQDEKYFKGNNKSNNKRQPCIEEIFKSQQQLTLTQREALKAKSHINLKKVFDNMPEKIYLQEKYNNLIHMKINSLQQARQINRNKQNYRIFMDQKSNSPLKSPNFTKMTFLLDKLITLPQENVMSNNINNQAQSYNKLRSSQVILSTYRQQTNRTVPEGLKFINNYRQIQKRKQKILKNNFIPNITGNVRQKSSKYMKKKIKYHNNPRLSVLVDY